MEQSAGQVVAEKCESILLVDDDVRLLDAMRRTVGRSYDLTVACGAEKALETIEREGPFAVVVSDYQMPCVDGIEFLRQVQQVAPDTVRIMLTGNADVQVAIDAVNQGQIFRFLRKPCPSAVFATELKLALRHYRQRQEEMNLATGARDNFMTTVSHELQTPITSIRASAEILMACQDVARDTQEEFLSAIVVESDRLSRLIKQILDVATIQAGAVHLEVAAMDLVDTITLSVRTVSEVLQGSSIDIDLELPRRPAICGGDRERLQSVITSLLSNAAKVTPRGGRIGVSLRHGAEGYELRVADQGPGVPDHLKAGIFERFVQKDDILTNRPQGAGLGLAMAKDVIEMHGGRIYCEDHPPGGAVFVVLLPV